MQLISAHLAIAQDPAQQTHTNGFASMNRNDRHATISMSNEVMATLDPDKDETTLLKS
jgi:hypothetical protein